LAYWHVLVVNMEQSGMDKERVVGPVREVVEEIK
jgi:hypothetical protein